MVTDIYNFTEEDALEYLKKEGVYDLMPAGETAEIKPKYDDLARLYYLVRKRKPFEILEFGSGFSTLAMAIACRKNWDEYKLKLNGQESIYPQPIIFSMETEEKWANNTLSKISSTKLEEYVKMNVVKVYIDCIDNQICHFYEILPDIVPDFAYIDGPNPFSVQGSINGLTFANPKRTVMSGDILRYESTLLPGFFMIIDGRTNNARFIERLLKREYNINYHPIADVTTFELNEERLGKKNTYGWEVYA